MSLAFRIPALLALLLPAVAFAHPGHFSVSSMATGLAHPILGFDHLLAIFALGIWAATQGKTMKWSLPLLFVLVMAFGAFVALKGVSMPFVEPGILASIFVLGLMLLTAKKMRAMSSVVLVAAFALFHGHAHGTEMLAGTHVITYFVGFILSSLAVCAAGSLFASKVLAKQSSIVTQVLGALVALGGLAFGLA